MFSSIKIENFRSFSRLELHDCRGVNLITGTNGSGKTGVLEAIFLNCEAGNVSSILTVNAVRGEAPSEYSNDRPFRSIFHDFDAQEHASIVGQWKDALTDTAHSHRELNLKPIFPGWNFTQFPDGKKIISGIEFDFKGSGKKIKTRGQWNESTINFQTNQSAGLPNLQLATGQPIQASYHLSFDPPQHQINLRSVYLVPNPTNSTNFLYQHLTAATKDKNLPRIIEIASIIDCRVTDLAPLFESGSNQIYVDIGVDKLIPLTMMGSGFSNILQIASGIIQGNRQVAIIDEIEDGLHYTTFPKLAKAIINVSRTVGLQFFISTHSGEFLDAFVDVARDDNFVDVCAFRLADKSGKKDVTRFASWELDDARKIELDLR